MWVRKLSLLKVGKGRKPVQEIRDFRQCSDSSSFLISFLLISRLFLFFL